MLLHTPSVRARELARDGRAHEFTGGLDALYGVAVAPVAVVTPAPLRGEATAS